MFTRRTTYGIRALASMAQGSGRTVSVAELAKREGLPPKFLALILVELRQQGIVRALRGRDGGYALAVDPAELSIAEVVECLSGPVFPLTCLASETRCPECRGHGPCAAELALSRASNAARRELSHLVLADVVSDASRHSKER